MANYAGGFAGLPWMVRQCILILMIEIKILEEPVTCLATVAVKRAGRGGA